MTKLNNRPELPDVFPEDEIRVESEEHTFEQFEVDSGTEDKLVYILDKAPVNRIDRVTGLDRDGAGRTFNNGVDYKLVDVTQDRENSFEYTLATTDYELTGPPDSNSLDVFTKKSDGTVDVSFTQGTDFTLVNPDDAAKDVIRWDTDETNPDPRETFFATYTVTFPDSAIQWQSDADNIPQIDDPFFVTYRAPSIIGRFLDSSEDVLDEVDEALVEAIDGKSVDTANSGQLDELGRLFGSIGKRDGRTDKQYRGFLKAIVGAFSSRGTVPGIKDAVSGVTELTNENITIIEDFSSNSYRIQIEEPGTVFQVETVNEAAELADPSGVEFNGTTVVGAVSLGLSVEDATVTNREKSGLGTSANTLGSFQLGD